MLAMLPACKPDDLSRASARIRGPPDALPASSSIGRQSLAPVDPLRHQPFSEAGIVVCKLSSIKVRPRSGFVFQRKKLTFVAWQVNSHNADLLAIRRACEISAAPARRSKSRPDTGLSRRVQSSRSHLFEAAIQHRAYYRKGFKKAAVATVRKIAVLMLTL